jgi:hypothetical protein
MQDFLDDAFASMRALLIDWRDRGVDVAGVDAILLAYSNANEIVVEMATQVLPVVTRTPVGVWWIRQPCTSHTSPQGWAGSPRARST